MNLKTPKGTELPLIDLKGKAYLMCAHRLVWFNEEVNSFKIETEFLKLEDTYAIARASIIIYDDAGTVLKQAVATKREDQKHFPDFIEKCETSAIGRALALLGFGTAYALADLEEGDRLLDSPLPITKSTPLIKAQVNTHQQDMKERAALNYKPDPSKNASDAQIKRLMAIAGSSGWSVDHLKKHCLEKYNINTSRILNQVQYQELCDYIQAHPIEDNSNFNNFEDDIPMDLTKGK